MSIAQDALEVLVQRFADDLRAAGGDETQERQACERAVAAYRLLDPDPDAMICETLRDGDGPLDGAFERVTASDSEFTRWSGFLADAAGY